MQPKFCPRETGGHFEKNPDIMRLLKQAAKPDEKLDDKASAQEDCKPFPEGQGVVVDTPGEPFEIIDQTVCHAVFPGFKVV